MFSKVKTGAFVTGNEYLINSMREFIISLEYVKNKSMAEKKIKNAVYPQLPDDNSFTGIISGGFTKDTLISTSEGPRSSGRLYLSDKMPEVITREGTVLQSAGVGSGGIREVFGLLTDVSYIKGAASHRVLRINPDCTSEMTELTDLRKGDVILYQKGVFGTEIPMYNDECLDISDAQELGKHISNMSRGNIQVSGQYSTDKFFNKSGYFSINVFNILNKFNNFVYRVPEKLLCAPAEFIAAYLRGYFDGGTRFHLNRITATAACRELASDIVYLLSLFGINGQIAKANTGFEVIVRDAGDIDRFIRNIGFLNKHDFSGSRSEPASTGINYKELCDEYSMRASASSQEVNVLPDLIAELMEFLAEYRESFILLGMGSQLETLELLSRKNCRVTEVTEYAKYTGKDEVFGVIYEEESHTWCANGIIVSGSIYNINPDSPDGLI
ncbi:TPA: LAGLIDADG family homing endonuclease [Salmonella enterica subsp. enterica serovar Muenchen]